MTTYPTERNTVELRPDLADGIAEMLVAAFPGVSVTREGDEEWTVHFPGGHPDEVVTLGDRVIFEVDDGFMVDRETKNLAARWAADARSAVEREAERMAEWKAKLKARKGIDEFGFRVCVKGKTDDPDGEVYIGGRYGVGLPHSCDTWVIASSKTKAEAVRDMRQFIVEAQAALKKLEAG